MPTIIDDIFPLSTKKHILYKSPKSCKMHSAMSNFNPKSSIILGMHDAIVSLVGLIAGLCFTFTNPDIIIISCIIASITAALSMAAANYLAVKSTNKNIAVVSAIYTGVAYLATCVLLLLPFFVFRNRFVAILSVFAIAILIIFAFNLAFYRGKRFREHFNEMLKICGIVTVAAFLIAEIANLVFGI